MPAQPPTVYLVDDDPSILASLSRLIRTAGLEVVAFDSADALLATPLHAPSCVVADLRMPGIGGLELQAELAHRDVEIPIVFLTAHGDVSASVRALKSGALDFLLKPVEPDVLLATIRAALGRSSREAGEMQRLHVLRRHVDTLTPREREVLQQVVRGLSNKEIGVALGAAEKTIKVHRGRIMQKMGADSLAELVRMAIALGLVGTTDRYSCEAPAP